MIEIKGLTKRFGALIAVDNLSLEIGEGEVFGFIGPNGAGKSTTMKVVASLLWPDAGEVRVGGYDVRTHGHEIRGIIGYMPDFLGVYDDLTVDEYLQFFAAAFKVPRKQRRTLTDSVLELTDLTDKRHAMVDSLSRGMQQRLGVARVLVHEPKVLLLDEPASGLDPRARIEMRSLLTELAKMGKSLMVSSHILSELAEMCSSIGIIERGQLLYSGSIEDAYKRTRAGDQISVRLEENGKPLELIARAIRQEQQVHDVAEDDGALVIQVAPGEHGHHFLIECIIAAGGRIESFEPHKIGLEDAFMKLTKGKVQ